MHLIGPLENEANSYLKTVPHIFKTANSLSILRMKALKFPFSSFTFEIYYPIYYTRKTLKLSIQRK